MRDWLVRLLILLLAGAPCGFAFSQSSGQKGDRKNRIQQEEQEDYWQKWLRQDVIYIITEEELDVFLKLTTEEEREQFVEQFWRRRDPDPATSENEFRSEHFRRIKYADERFHAGIPGWKTHRGMIYIKFGPPDRLESHPIGGPYARPAHEGGGHTSTFPFEIWNYRYLPEIGSDVEIEFVDVSGAGLYKITTNPFEKDEFLMVPWSGNTWAEDDPITEDASLIRWSRLTGFRNAGLSRSQGITFERAKDAPFARAELAAKLTAPPPITFTDLQTLVTTRVDYDNIPFSARHYYLRMTKDYILSPLTLEFPNQSLSFVEENGLFISRLQLYCRISSLAGRVVYEFDEELINQYTSEQYVKEKDGISYYHRSLALEPGRYKLHLAVKDEVSNRLGTAEQGLMLPAFDGGKLAASSIIFSSELGSAPPERALRDPYVFGNYRLRPRFDRTFANNEYLGIYFELYDFAIDSSTLRPDLTVRYTLSAVGPKVAMSPSVNISRAISFQSDHVSIPLFIDISGRAPADYFVDFQIVDNITGKTLNLREPFHIVAASQEISQAISSGSLSIASGTLILPPLAPLSDVPAGVQVQRRAFELYPAAVETARPISETLFR